MNKVEQDRLMQDYKNGYIEEVKIHDKDQALIIAAIYGHRSLVGYLYIHGATSFHMAFINACKHGHLEVAKLIETIGWEHFIRDEHSANTLNWGLRASCRNKSLSLSLREEIGEYCIRNGATQCITCYGENHNFDN